MGNEGRPIRFGAALPLREPAIADLLDPIALEERLREARARRTAALAGRRPVTTPPARPDFAEAASAFLHGPGPAGRADTPAPPPRIETFRTGRAVPAAAEPSPPLPEPVAAPVAMPVETAVEMAAREEMAEPDLAPVAAEPAVVAAPVATRTADRGLVRVPVWAIFATGLLLGAGVVAIVALTPSSPPQVARVVPGTEAAPAATAAVEPDVEAATAPAAPEVPAPTASAATPLPDIVAPAAMTAAAVPVPAADLPAPAVEPAPVPEDVLEVARLVPAPLAEAAPEAATPDPVTAEPVTAEPLTPEPGVATAAAPVDIAPRARPVATPVATPPAMPGGAPAAETETPVTAALPARVTIHYPASAAEEAERARAALAEAGVAEVTLLPVRLDISRSNVRFYHATDSAAATTVTNLLADEAGEAPLARDFTDYRTPAARGTLELWLAGSRPAGSASAAPRAAETPDTVATTTLGPAPTTVFTAAPTTAPAAGAPAPAAPLPLPAAVPGAAPAPTQAEAVARIIVERAYQRLVGAIPRN